LREALEQQAALRDVLGVISRSPFALDPVLDTVIQSAVRLSGADSGSVYRIENGAGSVAAHVGMTDEALAGLGEFYRARPLVPGRGSLTGRVLMDRQSVQIPDVSADPDYEDSANYPRSLLGVPLLGPDGIVGVIIVRRRIIGAFVGGFSSQQVQLVEAFAAQAVIAIENVRLFNEIQDKSQQLAAASRHKSEFLANMSHELRTPLNAIIGFSDVLAQRMFGEINPKQGEYVDDIRSSGQHLLSLINDILDLSKVEAGRMELELSRFSLSEALQAVVLMVRERAAGRGIALTSDIGPDIDLVEADERKIKQVVLNLLTNAVKFTPANGRVELSATHGRDGVVVAIRDTGVGIAPADQARVFEEFAQARSGATREQEGTGLGLTLSRKFVELHGGRIWVESEVGKGSTFRFTLPLRPSPSDDRRPGDAPAGTSAEREVR
jgi:signal transduction histidine kinase